MIGLGGTQKTKDGAGIRTTVPAGEFSATWSGVTAMSEGGSLTLVRSIVTVLRAAGPGAALAGNRRVSGA